MRAPLPRVTRFAPSPTGYLHLGHVRAALAGWQAARQAGGRFLVRLEDIDRSRCREEYAAVILDDLAWLGLDWGALALTGPLEWIEEGVGGPGRGGPSRRRSAMWCWPARRCWRAPISQSPSMMRCRALRW